MKEIILASASPRRAELLKRAGFNFRVIPSQLEEDIKICRSAEELVRYLSYEKAMSVARRMEDDSLVIGADTVVIKNSIMGKPENEKHAFEMLKSLQNGWHEVITGISVVDSVSLSGEVDCEITRVKMRELSDETIWSYINTGEPMDKAGAYGIQGIGAMLIEKIEGCYFNVVGLPMARLCMMMEKFGVKVL